jgi:hypothetical protein
MTEQELLTEVAKLRKLLAWHIRVYRVDDQHPDPVTEAERIMQYELANTPAPQSVLPVRPAH